MKDKFLKELYRYDEKEKSYHVVVDLDTYRDVYSEWDYSPMTNRDLDDDLLEYLMDCSGEVGLKRKMVIDFYIPKDIVNKKREEKSIKGFHHYFFYRIRKIQSQRGRKFRKLGALLVIGFLFIALANLLNLFIEDEFIINLISEGLFIGAWVALWEIFNTFFFNISELSHRIKHYKRLQAVPINYKVK
ncbi:MAG: hypothetical protein ACOCWI_04910 [Bacillota bacterium]